MHAFQHFVVPHACFLTLSCAHTCIPTLCCAQYMHTYTLLCHRTLLCPRHAFLHSKTTSIAPYLYPRHTDVPSSMPFACILKLCCAPCVQFYTVLCPMNTIVHSDVPNACTHSYSVLYPMHEFLHSVVPHACILTLCCASCMHSYTLCAPFVHFYTLLYPSHAPCMHYYTLLRPLRAIIYFSMSYACIAQ
jgi:hypothetical protein